MHVRWHRWYKLLAGMILTGIPLLLLAGNLQPVIPQVPASKATHCVEPTEVMRRDHMKFILHQRDQTVHNGIRTSKYSLKQCINCHVNPDENGEFPHYALGNEKHFCSSCHTYAAVNIDCFQCHRDTPSESAPVSHENMQSGMNNPENDPGLFTINDLKLSKEMPGKLP